MSSVDLHTASLAQLSRPANTPSRASQRSEPLGSSWASASGSPSLRGSFHLGASHLNNSKGTLNGSTGEQEEYDYADDEDVEMLKPITKLPDEAPKLPDSFLSLGGIGAGVLGQDEDFKSLSDTLDTVFFSSAGEGTTSKVGKRASNVLKLSAEADQLKAKLREMTERLEAAERRTAALQQQRASLDQSQPPTHHSHSSQNRPTSQSLSNSSFRGEQSGRDRPGNSYPNTDLNSSLSSNHTKGPPTPTRNTLDRQNQRSNHY